jgi:nucleoside-diphosphate-sugar epimerase
MKKNNKKTLIIGGSGYIGTVVNNFFQEKKKYTVSFDNLLYDQDHVKKIKKSSFIENKFETIKNIGEYIRINRDNIENIVILASLVGDPITKKYPQLSKLVNVNYTKKIINSAIKNRIKKLIFISTCSNYGVVQKNKIANENTKLNPKSIYSQNKVEIETYLKKFKESKFTEITILRFATAFGLSKRMRFDLTLNEFVRSAYLDKKLEIYDYDTWRPYCHVLDFAKIIYIVLFKKAKRKNFEIFNAGNSKNNFTKIMIAKLIKRHIRNINIILQGASKDPRDYMVNFDKLKKVYNYAPKFTLSYGVKEILNQLKKSNFINRNLYKDRLGNYKISKK